MNHIYKVIWSNVQRAYVVVSELTRSHGNCQRRGRFTASLAAVLTVFALTGSTAFAATNTLTEIGGTANTNNSIAVGSGTMAGDTTTGTPAMAIGENADATGKYSIALGFGVQESEDSVTKTTASGESAVAIGTDTQATGQHAVAIGSHSNATADSTVAIGYDTHANVASSVAIGSGSEATRGFSVAIGLSALAGADSSDTTATSLDGSKSVAVGYFAQATKENSIAMGYYAQATGAKNTTALGSASYAGSEGSVALGYGSSASRASGNTEDGTVLDAYRKPDSVTSTSSNASTWISTAGAVSVGNTSAKKPITRQITGVAAGSADTDAVNVAQLKAARTTVSSTDNSVGITTSTDATDYHTNYDLSVATASLSTSNGIVTNTNPSTSTKSYTTGDDVANAINHSGFNLTTSASAGTASGTSTELVNPGETVTLDAGKNIALTQAGNTITVATADDLGVNSITANEATIGGNTTIDSTGIQTNQVTVGTQTTLNDGSAAIGGISLNGTGENDGNSQHTSTITGLSNTTFDTSNTAQYANSTRAATEAQLKDVYDAASQHSTVTVNGGTARNLSLNTTTNENGSTNYDISLSNQVTIGSTGTNGQNGTLTVTSKDGNTSVTTNGGDGSLTFTDGSHTASIKAAAASAAVDGTMIDRVSVGNHTVATTDDGMKYSGDTGSQLALKLNENVNIKGGVSDTSKLSDNNIGVVSDGNSTLTVKLAKDLQGLNSVETTNLTATTVNAATVNATAVQASTVQADTVTGNTISGNIFTVAGDNSHQAITIQQGNVSMGGNTISNVAAGTVSADSTEAVNGSQLYQTNTAISNIGGAVTRLGDRVNRVGAGAAALAALHPLDFDPDNKWDFAAGYGNYHDANAVAVGAYYRPNEDTMFSVGGSFGGGENMVNAGVSFKLGQGNHVSTSRVAMAGEIKDLRENVAKLNDVVNRQSALIEKLTSIDAGHVQNPGDELFPDVPANHWAYEYVTKLAKAGIIEGYPDGEFKGDHMMTRYEFAALVYRAIMAGAASQPALNQDGSLDRLAKEFVPEMKYIRIDTIQKDKNGQPTIQRVRVNKDKK